MGRPGKPIAGYAVRCAVVGEIPGVGLRDATVSRARKLGVCGWIRAGEGREFLIHAEGAQDAVEALIGLLGEDAAASGVDDIRIEELKPEGYEQFAVRGVSAGCFEVVEVRRGFELRLEVEGAIRVWALPKAPSMDPAVKRMGFEAGDAGPGEEEGGTIWDAGAYEQGGRVPWPAAIERGHAVFVLHGAKLSGGFALQRIRRGSRTQWLLIKRGDGHARRQPDQGPGRG